MLKKTRKKQYMIYVTIVCVVLEYTVWKNAELCGFSVLRHAPRPKDCEGLGHGLLHWALHEHWQGTCRNVSKSPVLSSVFC